MKEKHLARKYTSGGGSERIETLPKEVSPITSPLPLVSVVIATRDRPEMLREAVDAVLSQDYSGPIETIVVFDQSEPDKGIEREGDHRSVRVTTNSRKVGLAGARNSGIRSSAGEYIAFCDDDDYWLPGRLSAQIAAISAWPDASLATTGIRVQYDGETFDRTLDAELVPMTALLRDRHTQLHPSTFLLRRSLLDAVGLVDEQVPGGFGEDYEFLLRHAKLHPIVNVAAPLVVVRWGKQSFFFRRWETMAAGLTWLLRRYPEFEASRRGSARVRGQIAFAHAAMGNRRRAVRWAASSWRRNPLELRAPLTVAVAVGLVRPDRVMEFLHNRGRGI
ncbi:glycosyltransferase family 2 protein [Microbacterium sp.]|uniref:glycosyltransferase family 2 protein n=1 Tax=Microbacterium sp. TaxID=51671 RepID=UPI0039E2FD6A